MFGAGCCLCIDRVRAVKRPDDKRRGEIALFSRNGVDDLMESRGLVSEVKLRGEPVLLAVSAAGLGWRFRL